MCELTGGYSSSSFLDMVSKCKNPFPWLRWAERQTDSEAVEEPLVRYQTKLYSGSRFSLFYSLSLFSCDLESFEGNDGICQSNYCIFLSITTTYHKIYETLTLIGSFSNTLSVTEIISNTSVSRLEILPVVVEMIDDFSFKLLFGWQAPPRMENVLCFLSGLI